MDPFDLPPEVKERRLRAIQARLAAATPRRRRGRRIARCLGIVLVLVLATALWWLVARR